MKLLAVASVLLLTQAASAQTMAPSPQDKAAILAIVKDSAAGKPNPHVSQQLDWENAFGIRYFDLAKRDAFYKAVVKPLQENDTGGTLEIKVRLVTPDVAVADEYWHEVGQLDVATHKPGPDRWGRTTYIFTKAKGQWTEVMERVADLRLAYFKHYDSLPKAVPVAADRLASYAGSYEFADNHDKRTITVEGDHLLVASAKRTRVAIPTSETEFLLFDPKDTAEYVTLHITLDAAGKPRIAVMDVSGASVGTLVKLP